MYCNKLTVHRQLHAFSTVSREQTGFCLKEERLGHFNSLSIQFHNLFLLYFEINLYAKYINSYDFHFLFNEHNDNN